ncbi:MAG: hypothetical protein AAB791_01580 [Patescibacteria group bacterium]
MKVFFLMISLAVGIVLGAVWHYATPISEYYWNFAFKNLEKKTDYRTKGAKVALHVFL